MALSNADREHARQEARQAPPMSPARLAQVVDILRSAKVNESLRPCPRTEVWCPYREADTSPCNRCEDA